MNYCMVDNNFVRLMFQKSIKRSFLPILLVLSLCIYTGQCFCYDTTLTQFNTASSVDFSFDNITFVAVDTAARQVNFWRIDTKELIYVYNTTTISPTCAKFSRNGNVIGIGMTNGDVILLNANTYTHIRTINPTGASVIQIDFSWMSSTSVISCSDSQIVYMNWATNFTWSLSPGSGIYSCKINKADGIGFSRGRELRWFTFNTTANPISRETEGSGDLFRQIDFSPETGTSMRMITASNRNNGEFYELRYNENNKKDLYTDVIDESFAACHSKDGTYAVGGDLNGRVYVIDTVGRNDRLLQSLKEGNRVTHCQVSYDSKYFALNDDTNGNIVIYTSNCIDPVCQQGFYLNNRVCTSCSSIFSCLACTGPSTCTACVQGFYLNGNSCASCTIILNCRSCESNSKCTQCRQGYAMDYSNNTCTLCESLVRGCISCERNSTNTTVSCRSCHAQFYLNSTDSLCYECSLSNAACMRCNSTAFCFECSLAFYPHANGTCQPCTGNCLQCSSSSSCIACAKGYYSLGGTCTLCSTNCFDCNNTGSCLTCARGFFLSGGNCSRCTPPCLACVTSATNCVTCALGFYLSLTGVCSRCINNCASCTAAAVCLSCQVGYYLLANNTCSLCSVITPNCVSCNSTQCFSCQNSYFLNSTLNCVNCLSNLVGCLSCNSSNICEHCHVGFYLTSPSCTPCASQCASCTSSSVCLSCAVGFYLSGTSCLQCSPHCVTCTANNTCLSCQNGYFLNTSATPRVCARCLLTLVGCVSCSSSTVCIECELGKYLSGNTCAYCPVFCSTCNSSACLSCNVGYYLTNTTCSKCAQNCSECSSSTLCSSCNAGFYLDSALSSNNCVSCMGKGCESCNATACLSCQIGLYLSAAACVICNTTLPNCYACSETLCFQCVYGYYSNAGACASCIGVINGCASCTNSSICTECTAGYYLHTNNTCVACPVQCKTCKNNVCTSCQMQYIFNAAGTDCVLCESFLDACLTCSSNSTCLNCYEGFYLTSGNQCTSCRSGITGCISCTNSSTCLVCQNEYYLLGGVCTNCRSIQACTYCQNSTICLSCISGYYLNGNTCSLCTSSLVGCLFCSSASTCHSCQTGYFLNTTSNQCQLCVNSLEGCLSCSSSIVCLNCDGGYYLDTGTFTCKSCNVTGCLICGDNSPSICSSCSLGYYLNAAGNACIACSQNACLQCSASALCLRCDSGYFLSGSNCSSCKASITACSKCSNGTVCSQCDSTYFLNSTNQCEQCSASLPFCEICFNSSYCTVCSSGYFSSSGSCTSCSTIAGCFMCIDASTCQNCVNGYYLSGSSCVTCASALSNCYQCDNSTTCLTCLSGFVLDTSSGVCKQVKGGSAPAPLPIPQVGVKTYYVSATQLKHVMSTRQSYSFTKQSLSWSTVTTISLYNSAARASVPLTIASVEWGSGLTSIIFYTNNPLNLSVDALSMPLVRLLLTQQDISFSYQTRFHMTKAALQLLMPDQVIPNDFTQQNPLMEPSFYMSYLQGSGEFYLSIIGFVIVGTLFLNFFIRATCTVSHSRNIGEIVPHILSLKTAVLMVFPIFPQIASFCYGMMAADLPFLNQYFSSLSYFGDIQPAGFQLFFVNMNFAAVYLAPFILFLLLLLLGYLTISKPQNKHDEVFSLHEEQEANRGTYAFLRMVFMYFSFGVTFAGAVSIQGSLYNPADYLSINGAFYMIGGIVYCIQMAVSIHLTRKESRSCYIRSFAKATLLSIAHISPVYICAIAAALDIALLSLEYQKHKEALKYPKIWVTKHLLTNFALVLLYFLNTRRIALMTVISLTFLSVLIELIEHVNEGTAEEPSKRVKPFVNSDKDHNQFQDEKNETKYFFIGDLKLSKESDIIEPSFGDTHTTFKNTKVFTQQDFIYDQDEQDRDAISSQKVKSPRLGEKRHRPFRALPRKKEVKIEPILENGDSSRE